MPTPQIIALVRQRLAATAAAVPGLIVSDDRDFLDGLIHNCAIEYDANAAGGTVGLHAGTKPDWQPVVGLESVACRIVWKRSAPTEGEARPGVVTTGTVLFGQSISADRRNRLAYTDPDRGTVRHAYLTGEVRNAHMMNHHWVADVQDRAL